MQKEACPKYKNVVGTCSICGCVESKYYDLRTGMELKNKGRRAAVGYYALTSNKSLITVFDENYICERCFENLFDGGPDVES